MLHEWAVYLDLDGVFADYDAGIRRLGFEPDPAKKNELNRSGSNDPFKRAMYEAIQGTDFYARLPMMQGSAALYTHVKDAKPIILTAAPKFGATEDDYFLNPYWLGAAYHKRRWVEDYLLPEALPEQYIAWGMALTRRRARIEIEDERFICTTSARKHEFIGRKHGRRQLLIDDRRDNCVRWARAGGAAILHTDVRETIASINVLQYDEPDEVRAHFKLLKPDASLADDRCGMIAGLDDTRTWAEVEAAAVRND
jgi:hypothetical protein